MPKKDEVVWDCPEQTKVKHRILTKYLNAWFPILGIKNGRIVYIDGFAGPGVYKNGEKGSPVLAIETALGQQKYIDHCEVLFQFVEEDKDRADNLRETLSEITLPENFKYDIEVGSFEPAITPVLDELDKQKVRNAPVFAFLDPFGFSDISYNLLKRLLSLDRIEVFVYFPRNSVNRFLEVEKVSHHMESLFGTSDITIPTGEKRINYLKTLYENQVRKIAKFVGCFTMVNEKGVPNYDLFFASNHPLGYLKMKEAMWAVDQSGGFRFSVKDNPAQSLLFQHDPLAALERIILGWGRQRKGINIDLINKAVCEQTIYLPSHMKIVLKRLENDKKINVQPQKANGEPRRGRFFADGTIIDFV